MKFTVVGDIHLADRPPSSRVDTYRQDIMNKLKWIVEYSNEQDNEALLLLGDVFHIKRPDRNSHSLVTETAEVLGESKAPVVIIPGNHDLCVPESVEAFTDKGWKTVNDLDGTEKFITMDIESGEVCYQAATQINRLHYCGEGYKFQGTDFDIVTTPNHRWPVHAPALWEPTNGFRKSSYLHNQKPTSYHFRYLRVPDITINEDPEKTIRVGDYNIAIQDIAHIFGWWVSEFSNDSHIGVMKDYASAWGSPIDSTYYLRKVLDDYGIPYDNPNVYTLTITDKEVTDYLENSLLDNGSIKIPGWFLELGSEFCGEFIFGYTRGDEISSRAMSESAEDMVGRTVVFSPDVELAVTQVLAYYGCMMSIDPYVDTDGEFVGNVISFRRFTRSLFPNPEVIQMDEDVWCPTLPNGTWLCKSNGKVLWTGNSNDDLHSIPSQPLGTLALHPNIEILIGPHNELPLFSVPYFDPTPENFKHWADEYHRVGGSDKYPFIGTHQAIFPKKEEPIYDYISAESWADAFGSRWTAYGHIHSRMRAGAFYTKKETVFCNNGAISRGSLHEETINRKLAITDFDSEAQAPFVSVPIPFKPAADVFLLEVVDLLNSRKSTVDTFVQSLGSSELNYLTVEGIVEDAKANNTLSRRAVLELEDIVMKVTTEK